MSSAGDSLRRARLRVEPAALRAAGGLAVRLIVERTQDGRDRDGAAFLPYSTRPLAVPSGSTTKTARKALERAGLLQYFTTKRGTLWMLIEGGYAALKRARYPQDGDAVNLSASGAMLRGLGVVSQTADSVTLGFSRAELTERAAFNMGTRDFLGLTAEDEAEIAAIVEAGLRVV
jgi:hypothetical protein